jgi:apolipoprotein N-acyltransferase
VLLPMAWASLELLRSAFPEGGFGWLALAHSQAAWRAGDGPVPVVQIADLVGEHGVSLVVAMSSGLVADAWLWWREREPAAGLLRGFASLSPRLLVVAGTVGAACIYGWTRPGPQVVPGTPAVSVAVIQTNVPQSNKDDPDPAVQRAIFGQMVDLTIEAQRSSEVPPEVYVWPETMVTVALNTEALAAYREHYPALLSYDTALRELANRLDATLVVGAPVWLDWGPQQTASGSMHWYGRGRNGAYVYRPTASGEPVAEVRYDKMHLVPFGEYIPGPAFVKRTVLGLFSPYDTDYTIQPGESSTAPVVLMQVDPASGQRHPLTAGLPICFEDVVGPICRRMVVGDGQNRPGAAMLLNLTNDGWFGPSQNAQHLQIATLRSIENRVPMARAVNTGISGFIDDRGVIQSTVEVGGLTQGVSHFAVDVLTLREGPGQGGSLYRRWGRAPMWGVAAVTGLLGLTAAACSFRERRSRRRTAASE